MTPLVLDLVFIGAAVDQPVETFSNQLVAPKSRLDMSGSKLKNCGNSLSISNEIIWTKMIEKGPDEFGRNYTTLYQAGFE